MKTEQSAHETKGVTVKQLATVDFGTNFVYLGLNTNL